jgi:hypothetical protein
MYIIQDIVIIKARIDMVAQNKMMEQLCVRMLIFFLQLIQIQVFFGRIARIIFAVILGRGDSLIKNYSNLELLSDKSAIQSFFNHYRYVRSNLSELYKTIHCSFR